MSPSDYNSTVDKYADALYRFACKLMRSNADAQDMVQNTFEALWKEREKVTQENSKSWLFTVLHRKCIDHYRQNKRIEYADEIPQAAFISAESGRFETQNNIDYILGGLSEIQRSVLMLRDYEGYDYAAIGEITGLSESQVKVYIFRARQKLQPALKHFLQ